MTLIRPGEVLVAGKLIGAAAVPGDPPPRFADRTRQITSKGRVWLGSVPAIKYADEDPNGPAVALYVIATDHGDIGLLCRDARDDGEPCEVSSLRVRLHGWRSVEPGPDPTLARGLTKALKKLATETKSSLVSIKKTSSERLARRFKRIVRQAVHRLMRLSPEPRDRKRVAAVTAALQREANALRAAAYYAHESLHQRYASAAKRAKRRSHKAILAIQRLREIGFTKVPAPGLIRLPALPPSPRLALSSPGVAAPAPGGIGGGSPPAEPYTPSQTNDSGSDGATKSVGKKTEPSKGIETSSTE